MLKLFAFAVIAFVMFQNTELKPIAQDTWNYFSAATAENGLTDDHINFIDNTETYPNKTSPTNIAMYLIATSCAKNLNIIQLPEAEQRIDKTLSSLSTIETNNGFFLNWYVTNTGATVVQWEEGGPPLTKFLSSVDNAWLAASLIHVRSEYPGLKDKVNKILLNMNFKFFYDTPAKHFYVGYNIDEKKFTEGHYAILNSETRLITYVAGALKQLDMNIIDDLVIVRREGTMLSCFGSMFEAMAVPLLIPEIEDSPRWKVELTKYVDKQVNTKIGDYWGSSYSDNANNIYKEFGLDSLSIFPMGFTDGVVTPYASFLALQTHKKEAIENINKLRQICYGNKGFVSAYRPSTGEKAKRSLTLEQGCVLLAIADAEKVNPIKDEFENLVNKDFPKEGN